MGGLLPESFTTRRVDVDGVGVNCAVGGAGPPLLMLHGYPQNHLMWHQVAPALAAEHTVVLADLRGYGDSAKPEPDADNQRYAKRAMAADQVGLMAALGFDRFALVGHDRGARVAHRLALDSPEAVTRLAVLDIVPTRHVFATVDRTLASGYWHWFFLPLGGGLPERLIGADPAFFLNALAAPLAGGGFHFDADAMADYVRCFSDPATIAATCADYRAAASTDLAHDDASAAAGEVLRCPTLVLWGEHGFVGRNYDVLAVWREYAPDAQGFPLPTNHFLAEEDPGATTAALREFLHT